MGIVILPYKMASESSKILADKLRCMRILREKSKYKHKNGTIIINWGCPERPEHIPADAKVVNPFEAVKLACNKKDAFNAMIRKGVMTPNITDDKDTAYDWLSEGKCVLARTILNGHGGNGIVIMENPDDIVDAPLYSMYVPKKSEWRVHVFNGSIIDATRKVLREDHPDKDHVNWKIRNHDNGFIFQRFNPKKFHVDGSPILERDLLPGSVKANAVAAVRALNLDFGAVDIIYNESQRRAYVLEVNTAPGIADTTSDIYVDYLRAYIEYKERENLVDDERLIRFDEPVVFEQAGEPIRKRPAKNGRPIRPEWPEWPRPRA